MRAASCAVLILLLLALLPGGVVAQDAPQLHDGTRIRVKALASHWVEGGLRRRITVVGTFVSLNEDSLLFRIANRDSALSIPRSSVRGLYVSHIIGGRTRRVEGTVIGLVIGAPLGYLIGRAFDKRDSEPAEYGTAGRECKSAWPYALVGAGICAILGYEVGSKFGPQFREKWQEVPLDEARISLSPHSGREPGLMLSLLF